MFTQINNSRTGGYQVDTGNHVQYSTTWDSLSMVSPQAVWSTIKDSLFQLLPIGMQLL